MGIDPNINEFEYRVFFRHVKLMNFTPILYSRYKYLKAEEKMLRFDRVLIFLNLKSNNEILHTF